MAALLDRLPRWVGRLFTSTSRRVLILFPAVVAVEQVHARRRLHPVGFVLMLWGWLQYRGAGRYRARVGGGGPGIEVPPERLVTTGAYRFTRNPMYLGHLIFLSGLTVATRSPLAAGILMAHLPWFSRRVREDEARLEALFGEPYRLYRDRVPRWLPRPDRFVEELSR